jgi:hypothetical protein
VRDQCRTDQIHPDAPDDLRRPPCPRR